MCSWLETLNYIGDYMEELDACWEYLWLVGTKQKEIFKRSGWKYPFVALLLILGCIPVLVAILILLVGLGFVYACMLLPWCARKIVGGNLIE